MACNEIHKSDIGTIFRVTVKDCTLILDVSAATTKEIVFGKPDGTVLTKAAAFFSDGTDGIIQYTTVSGDLSAAGDWSIQAHVIFSGGEWRSDVGAFKVHANIE